MAFDQRNLDDYVDVAERIQQFYDTYPKGSLRTIEWKILQAQGFEKNGDVSQQTFIVYHAEAKRDPADFGSHGMAWEIFPGRTPYTRGSELMNAETSAWGRALAALGIATKRGIASREEVRNRQAERDDGLPVNRDGSLSRSRTSDEEKAAAGVMTDAQQKEHNQLAKPPPNSGNVTRLRAGDDFDTVKTDLPNLADEIENQPGTIDSRQSQAMHAHFNRLGIKDRAVRLKVTEDALRAAGYWRDNGSVLTSSNELSWRQAEALVAALKEMKPGDA